MADKDSKKPLDSEDNDSAELDSIVPEEKNKQDTTAAGDSEAGQPEQAEADNEADTPETMPVATPTPSSPKPAEGRFKRCLRGYWAKKKWTLPLTVVVLLLIVLVIPFTRYPVLGLFIKKQVSITLLDKTTNTPVSGATVTIGGQSLKTQGSGEAKGMVKLGKTKMTVTKQYYKTQSQDVTVTLSKSHNNFKVSLQATGRQVPIKVTNKVTGKGLADVEIKILDTEAKTDKDGRAVVVVSTGKTGQQASASFAKTGFNGLTANIQVTNKTVAANEVSLTPAGKLYFLSNKTGTLDVVKSNLDGSDRQVVLKGTGREESRSTSLLASRDWKYLALLSRRDGDRASVYLIDTTQGDKLTTIDEGDANFQLSGWSNNTFVYRVLRNNPPSSEPGQALKGYDAANAKLTVLDQLLPRGTETAQQDFGTPYIIGDQIYYAKNWSSTGGPLVDRSADLLSVKNDGSNKRTIKSFTPASGTSPFSAVLNTKLYAPAELYISFHNGTKYLFYEYENGQVKETTNVTESTFYSDPYPTYLASPSGKQTFWAEPRDGKNTLFVGDAYGDSKKQIATQSEYTPFGWYSDDYLLVSKQASELYIMPADGSAAPQKITDYYKPALVYIGYGGGYGGL